MNQLLPKNRSQGMQQNYGIMLPQALNVQEILTVQKGNLKALQNNSYLSINKKHFFDQRNITDLNKKCIIQILMQTSSKLTHCKCMTS